MCLFNVVLLAYSIDRSVITELRTCVFVNITVFACYFILFVYILMGCILNKVVVNGICVKCFVKERLDLEYVRVP